MFSGFRNVMENLAQPQPRPGHPGRSESQEVSPNSDRSEHHHPRGSASFDLSSVAQSTGHLAESAFSNLRKSLTTQRPFSVVSPSMETNRAASASPQPDRELKPVSKPTLEDRLRASFAIGDLSGNPTPFPSHAPSPSPRLVSVPNGVRSPESTPLPDSPPMSPSPVDLTSPQQSKAQLPSSASTEHPLSDVLEERPAITKEKSFRIAISPPPPRYPEADIPLPLFSPTPTNLSASQSSQSSASSSQEVPQQPNGVANPGVDGLLARLKFLETQYNTVSSTLERLTSSQEAANTILTEFTTVSDISDAEGLKEYLLNLKTQQNASQEEIKRLTGKLRVYDERIEELRDTHRLESRSLSELVDNLRKQLEESEALLKAAQTSSTQAEENSRVQLAEVEQARAETQKLKDTVKEEEEKRVKAISLLKTVRQKLVKAEKDRDEALKEVGLLKEREKATMERERAEKAKLEKDLESIRAEKDREIAGLKAHYDRELIMAKERLEKEFSAWRGQLEAETASTKASFQKEIATKNTKIQTLESTVNSLGSERDSLFDQLQLRQAEVESSQTMLESLQSSTAELQYQIRDLTDRNALLTEQLADAQRELEYRSQQPSLSAEDTDRIRAASEARYKAKVDELTMRLAEAERDRNDMESALSRNLQQKTQEIEALKKVMDTSSQSKGVGEEEMRVLKQEIDSLRHETSLYKEQLSDLDRQRDRVNELEAQLQRQNAEFNARAEQYEREVSEARERERQVRASNKTLREELRKVQSSAALLERQRNPGVGYWSNATRHDNRSEANLASPTPSTSDLPSSPRDGSPAPVANEEEVNLEYLRNVILQFLEHKEMRPHLVRVLSIILRFTPQETRRLVAKV